MRRLAETFLAFLSLGLTSFGGPIAHLGYFHAEFVTRRAWLTESDFADLVALCQAIPGPASSQVGMAIGYRRAGFVGAVAAFFGFTLPSVVILYAVTLGASIWNTPLAQGMLHGLKLAAVAVVALAVWQMVVRLTPDWPRRSLAGIAAALILLVPLHAMPLVLIALTAVAGALLPAPVASADAARSTAPHPVAAAALVAFALLLAGLPILAATTGDPAIDVFDRFYRSGALVFGGGHVVLPLLEGELVAPGLIDRDLFLAGYGAAQAIPGPLFSFAFYTGVLLHSPPNGIPGGLLALGGIYLPSLLLVLGTLPHWERLRAIPRLRRTLDIVNATVVGLLVAAFIDPVMTGSVTSALDVLIAAIALAALYIRVPVWLTVIACGVAGSVLALF